LGKNCFCIEGAAHAGINWQHFCRMKHGAKTKLRIEKDLMCNIEYFSANRCNKSQKDVLCTTKKAAKKHIC
jgi:hypothetical protein